MEYTEYRMLMYKAEDLAYRAFKRGEIKKEQSCAECNNPNPRYIIGHHADYNKPLEITCMCRSCHQKLHAHYGRDYQFLGPNSGYPTL